MALIAVLEFGDNNIKRYSKQWFASQGVRDGRILISLANEGKVADGDAQLLYFNDAKCFALSEFYDIDASKRRLLKLGITASEITIDDVIFYGR